LWLVFLDLENIYSSKKCFVAGNEYQGYMWNKQKIGTYLYEGEITRVKSLYEETEKFSVRVGVHQSLALSFYRFTLRLGKPK